LWPDFRTGNYVKEFMHPFKRDVAILVVDLEQIQLGFPKQAIDWHASLF